jgi:hypothetical protein
MDVSVPFASTPWFVYLAILLFGRSMDFISTWVATPYLVLEGNPIVKMLGWRCAVLLNLSVSLGCAFYPFLAVAITTMSLLVAARNFQGAWLMRLLGEEGYRDWHVARVQETPTGIYLLCLLGQTVLVALIGAALVTLNGIDTITFAIGCGILIYVVAVVLFTLLAFWRIRRSSLP